MSAANTSEHLKEPNRLRRLDWGYAVAVLAALPAIWPLTLANFLQVHDGFAHLFRLVVLDDALRQGVYFPRWSPELVFGYGYPIFNFYNPLVSYAAEAFHLAGLTFTDSLRALIALEVLLSAAAMYWFLRLWFGRWGALLGSVAYVYVPYHLLNIYVRGSIAELVCYPMFPLALGLADRTFPQRGAFKPLPAFGLAATISGLVLGHNPSALFFCGILGGYVVWRWRWQGARALVNWLVGGVLTVGLALAVTAFFWLPFLADLRYTWIGTFGGGVEDFYRALQDPANLFQFAPAYDYNSVWETYISVGLVQAVLALGGTVALLWVPVTAKVRAGFGVVLALAILLAMSKASEPLWRAIPLASLMTFPWRLQAGMGLATALAAAALPLAFRRWGVAVAIPAAGLMIWASISALAPNPLQLDNALVNRASAARLDLSGALTGTTSPPQFVPKWVASPVQQFAEPGPAAATNAARLSQAELLEFDPWRFHIRATADRAGMLVLRAFYFPGWQASIDGAAAEITPSGPDGAIGLAVPAGEHDIAIWFGSTPTRRAGEITSVVALAAALVYLAFLVNRRAARLVGRVALAGFVLVVIGANLPRPASAFFSPSLQVTPALRLLGWKPDFADLGRRGVARLELVWLTAAPQPAGFSLAIRLLDSSGKEAARQVRPPYYGTAPSSRWPVSSIVPDSYDLPLPAGLQPGNYQVEIAALDGKHDAADPAFQPIGELSLPSAPNVPPARQPATPAGLTYGGNARLTGFDLSGTKPGTIQTAQAGDTLNLTLYWEALRQFDIDYSTFVHLTDNAYRVAAQTDSYGGLDLRFTTVWEVGRQVRDRYRLLIPAGTPAGVYTLSAGLFDRATGDRLDVTGPDGKKLDSAPTLAKILVLPPAAPAEPMHASGASWPHVGRLSGYDLPGEHSLADCATLDPELCSQALILHWTADGTPDANLSVFVHVLDASGKLVAQHDGQPRLGLWPTSAWSAGNQIVDPHPLTGLDGLPSGDYRIEIGLYRPDTGERIRAEHGDSAVIGTLHLGGR